MVQRRAFTLMLLLPCLAQAQGAAPRAGSSPISSRFTAQKVVRDADGKESLEDAANVSVGDTVQYSVQHRNVSKRRLLRVDFGIPIPAGTSYVEGSASPEGARRVKKAKGPDQMQWRVEKLDPGDEAVLSLRVKIDPDPMLTPAPVEPRRPEFHTR